MEEDSGLTLDSFLASEEKLVEVRLRRINGFLMEEAHGESVNETLQMLRQNAEEDLSNILHIRSIHPGGGSGKPSSLFKKGLKLPSNILPSKTLPPVKSTFGFKNVFGDKGAVLGQVDEDVEAAVAVTDDLFLMEGVDELRSPASLQYSEEEQETEEEEPDEGIHIPSKVRGIPGSGSRSVRQMAASLPVGIPWPQHQAGQGEEDSKDQVVPHARRDDSRGRVAAPTDIAASIQAMAASVHTSSIFGDNVFGELPRPRLNTATKE